MAPYLDLLSGRTALTPYLLSGAVAFTPYLLSGRTALTPHLLAGMCTKKSRSAGILKTCVTTRLEGNWLMQTLGGPRALLERTHLLGHGLTASSETGRTTTSAIDRMSYKTSRRDPLLIDSLC